MENKKYKINSYLERFPRWNKKNNTVFKQKKSIITSCIPVKHLTESLDIYLPFLTGIINQSPKHDIFPDELKLAEVTPLF